jgi:hypothetical protein
MNTLVIKADNKVTKLLIEICRAFGVSFEMKKERKKQIEKEYDSEFVNTILESKKQIENGNSKVIKTEDLWT